MKLTEHFTLEEFCESDAAARMGAVLRPTQEVILNLTRLCHDVLEPLRTRLQKPIIITSGYRPEWLNKFIGGAPNSAHLTGRAADIKLHGMPPRELVKYIRNQGFPVDKCILEFEQWTHVQISPSASVAPRHRFLTALHIDGHTQYSESV